MPTIADLLAEAEREEWVSVKALAAYYRCCEVTIYRQIRRRKLPHKAVGRTYYLPRQAVAYLGKVWGQDRRDVLILREPD